VEEKRRTAFIAGLVDGIATRPAEQERDLTTTLMRRCWPHGGDGVEPVALQWLRRWRPMRLVYEPPECACATGRCGVCN